MLKPAAYEGELPPQTWDLVQVQEGVGAPSRNTFCRSSGSKSCFKSVSECFLCFDEIQDTRLVNALDHPPTHPTQQS